MENKAIQIEPKAATEMQSQTNIYDRVPSRYRQMEPTNELITKSEAYAEGFSVVLNNECMTKAEFVANLSTSPHFSYDFPLGNKRSIVIINGSIASKTIQINDDTVVLNPKDVWTKSYYDTTPIDVITQTNLEFRMIHSEGDSKNNNSQWVFPDEILNAQTGNYLLTVPQTHELYLVSVFYITQ